MSLQTLLMVVCEKVGFVFEVNWQRDKKLSNRKGCGDVANLRSRDGQMWDLDQRRVGEIETWIWFDNKVGRK